MSGWRDGLEPLFEPGEKIAVLGLGASGAAAARLAGELGAEVYASDVFAGGELEETAAGLRIAGVDAQTGGHDIPRILASRLVVVSPGIDPSTEVRRAVREADVRAVAEVELAFRTLTSRIIGITGTNGKTTTTALCGHLLAESGLDVVTAGNIGRPLSEVALLETPPELAVVELSSFQLADLEAFDPWIGVLLNLAPDHLDRYADLESYYRDKRRLFLNATEASRWVLNADDPEVMEMARDVKGTHYGASVKRLQEPGADLEEEMLSLRLPGRGERWVSVDELQLVGRHNVMNALLAGLAAALAGCEAGKIARGFRSFEGLPHRLQPVGEFDGVLWVNDSKGTNVSASRVAIAAFQRPVVVLLGGRHKGEPYSALLPELERNARGVVVFGEAAPQIVAELGEGVPLAVAGGMNSIVRTAREMAEPGDVVVLSPACSSYDMFPSYAERGRAFEREVLHAFAPAGNGQGGAG